jgi:DNA-binding MarR family transcriptional regulator
MLKPNSKLVYDYVKENGAKNITAADIAEATGLPVRSVNGIVTAAFQRKGLMERVEAEVELEDGTHKSVKFIKLTPEGENFDPEAEDEKAE